MKTQCSHCSSQFEVSSEYLDKTASCPICRGVFLVKEINVIELDQAIKPKKKPWQIWVPILGLVMFIIGIAMVVSVRQNIPLFVGPMCIIGFLLMFAFFTDPSPKSKRTNITHVICPNPNCHYQGEASAENNCSLGLMIILLLLGIVPGLLYIIASGGLNKVLCPKCGIRIR